MHHIESCMPIRVRRNWPRLTVTRGAAVSYLAPNGIVLLTIVGQAGYSPAVLQA